MSGILNFSQFLQCYIKVGNDYRLVVHLQGHQGPINCLCFSPNGRLLASGSDDGCIKIWSIEKSICTDTITNSENIWGQITSIKFLDLEGEHLVFGTGRGFVIFMGLGRDGIYHQIGGVRASSAACDVVESLLFDCSSNRLAVTSYYGEVRAYTLDLKNRKSNALFHLDWSTHNTMRLPRATAFTNDGHEMLVFGLNTGDVTTMATNNGEILSTISLKCPIGTVSVCAGGDLAIVNNIGLGFNLYNFRTGMLIQTTIMGCTSSLITDVRFHENSAVVVGGSGRGRVYVVSLQQNTVVQELRHGGDTDPVQAIDTICVGDCYWIASGSSASEPDICIWEKEIKGAVIRPDQADKRSKYLLFALCVLTGTLLLIIICQNLPVGVKIFKESPNPYVSSWNHQDREHAKVRERYTSDSMDQTLKTIGPNRKGRYYNRGDRHVGVDVIRL